MSEARTTFACRRKKEDWLLHNLSIDCFVKARRGRVKVWVGYRVSWVRLSGRVVGCEAQEQSTPGQTDGRGTSDGRDVPYRGRTSRSLGELVSRETLIDIHRVRGSSSRTTLFFSLR